MAGVLMFITDLALFLHTQINVFKLILKIWIFIQNIFIDSLLC